jgi:valyl-tRNA synthetase
MPFITEELWGKLGGREDMLIAARWPAYDASLLNPEASAEIDWLVRLIGGIRTVRAEMNVPVAAKLPLLLQGASPEALDRFARHEALIFRLARIEEWREAKGDVPRHAVQVVIDEATVVLPLEGVIDIEAERGRLQKEIEKTEKEIGALDKRLSSPGFVAKAPEDVVAEARQRLESYRETRSKLDAALARLK